MNKPEKIYIGDPCYDLRGATELDYNSQNGDGGLYIAKLDPDANYTTHETDTGYGVVLVRNTPLKKGLTTRTIQGKIWVDSGQISILDIANFEPIEENGETLYKLSDENYQTACRHGNLDFDQFGVVTGTEGGDGTMDVTFEVDSNGYIVSVYLETANEYEDEDEYDYDDEDEYDEDEYDYDDEDEE